MLRKMKQSGVVVFVEPSRTDFMLRAGYEFVDEGADEKSAPKVEPAEEEATPEEETLDRSTKKRKVKDA